jgi:hypothetical protein
MMEVAFRKHSMVLLQLQVTVLVVVDLHGQYTLYKGKIIK